MDWADIDLSRKPRGSRSRPRAVIGTCALAAAGIIACAVGAWSATDTIVTVTGEIVPLCDLSGLATSVSLGSLEASGTQTLGFAVTCNAPFAYSLASTYGALRHSSGSSAPPGFSALFPYSARVIIPTDTSTIDDTCASSTILSGSQTCTFTDSGTGIAFSAASQLQLSWTGAANLLGGSYSDTLRVTVSIRP